MVSKNEKLFWSKGKLFQKAVRSFCNVLVSIVLKVSRKIFLLKKPIYTLQYNVACHFGIVNFQSRLRKISDNSVFNMEIISLFERFLKIIPFPTIAFNNPNESIMTLLVELEMGFLKQSSSGFLWSIHEVIYSLSFSR